MARRLIDRMSSLIIDKECLESLIDLVEYKIKQKLTPLQRRMLNKRHKKPIADVKTDSKKTSKSGRKPKSTASANKRGKAKNADTSDEEDQDNEEEEDGSITITRIKRKISIEEKLNLTPTPSKRNKRKL